jgi:hypothetical protein
MEQRPSWKADQFSQLTKKFPAVYGTRRFFTVLTSARHMSLSWANSIESPRPLPTSSTFILILHYKTHTYTNPHISKSTHTQTHTYKNPHITKPTHTQTHTLQNKFKTTTMQVTTTQLRTQKFCLGGVGVFQQIQLRTDGRKDGGFGGGSPLVRG